jgi:hypothetical protein
MYLPKNLHGTVRSKAYPTCKTLESVTISGQVFIRFTWCIVTLHGWQEVESTRLEEGDDVGLSIANCALIGQYKRAAHSLSSIIATATSTTSKVLM